MAMDANNMVQKVKDAYEARTGETMTDGTFNVLVDLCQGIIDEITENASINGTVTSGPGAGGSVTGTVS